ncbi:MAG: hypothetical protein KDC28_08955, partial [Saprospiraceae bacterium]|nr:hypothetical protein [Saprospiraceae bacterium]
MSQTNFTFIKFIFFVITLSSVTLLNATNKPLAGACSEATLTVNAGDTIYRNIKFKDCASEFEVPNSDFDILNGFDPSIYCKSVTHIVPSDPTMSVMINLLDDYIIDGGVNVISRVLVLNGHVDEALLPSVCANMTALNIPSGSAQVDTLFDNFRNGSSITPTTPRTFTSTTDDGELTVVYYIVSASDGRIPFRAGLNRRPSPPDGVCNLSCHDQVTISMNSSCDRQVTPADVLSDIDEDCTNLITMLAYPYDFYNDRYPNRDQVDVGLVGADLIYKVIDLNTNNTCWGHIKVEDKYPPQIECRNITVSCLVADEASNSVSTAENCTLYGGPQVDILSKKYVSFDCEESRDLIGYMARKVRATDIWGNFRECQDTIFIWKETIDSVVCPPDTLIECTTEVVRNGKTVELLWNTGKKGDTYLDEQGYAHPWPTDGDGYFPAPYLSSVDPLQDPAYMIPEKSDDGPVFGTGGKCMIVYEYTDYVLPTCGKSYKIRRVWDIYDWCTKRDTQCIQWIKITDTQAPVIDPNHLNNIFDNVIHIDLDHECDYVPESVHEKAIELGAWIACEVLKADSDPHDCKSGVTLPDPRAWVLKDCDDQLDVYYEIEYLDPSHPGKTVLESGSIAEGSTAHVYLPAGWHNVVYHIRDRCWNETLLLQGISIYDNTPPTPVCDEITQVTLDPENCWARVYAKDLDDGSHDNCCDQLHFAVASMDSITYWRDYWHEYYAGCLDPYDYHHYSDAIDQEIEDWINIFVFDDYIDVTECGDEQLVLRVYEACDVPLYDPHLFYGGEHEWYWWNLSYKFAAWYIYRLNDYIHYGDPRPALTCDHEFQLMNKVEASQTSEVVPLSIEIGFKWDFPMHAVACFALGNISNPMIPIVDLGFFEHGTYQAPICDYYFDPASAESEWRGRVQSAYPTETTITVNALSTQKRWHFPHLYNDCMIQVLKDDKQPPVVV